MTFEELADFLVDRWGNSQRISMRGRAIVISKTELEMITVALRGGGALRRATAMTSVYLRNLYTEDEGWYPCEQDHPDAIEFVPAATVARMRAALEVIAGSADRLQALQAAAALDNIGAKV